MDYYTYVCTIIIKHNVISCDWVANGYFRLYHQQLCYTMVIQPLTTGSATELTTSVLIDLALHTLFWKIIPCSDHTHTHISIYTCIFYIYIYIYLDTMYMIWHRCIPRPSGEMHVLRWIYADLFILGSLIGGVQWLLWFFRSDFWNKSIAAWHQTPGWDHPTRFRSLLVSGLPQLGTRDMYFYKT